MTSAKQETFVIITQTIVSKRNINSIVCDALETGISYWAADAETKLKVTYLPDGTSEYEYPLPFNIIEVADGEKHALTLEKILDSFSRAANYLGKSVQEIIDDYDSSDADIIIQFALFGEARYS